MIRQLKEKDREMALDFVSDRPAENLFIIGDIEAFGFESDTVAVWGDFEENGSLKALLLRYRGNYIPYARDVEKLDEEAWGQLIRQDGHLKMISGLKTFAEKVISFSGRQANNSKLCFYAKREAGLPLDRNRADREVRMLFPEEADRIAALRAEIPEFSVMAEDPEVLRKEMEQGRSRTFYIEKEDEPVSAVSTAAETGGAAMIVGVCTKKGFERQGFATRCLTKLIGSLEAEHKQPCLFYDNPSAGRIYKKFGFIDIGEWMMASY